MTTTQIVVTVIVVLAVAALVGIGWFVARRRALQQRFGPEYDRAVAEQDSRTAAERELRERERKHAALELKDLAPDARQRYTAEWEDVQARFVESPDEAVRAADELTLRLITERGYPADNYEEQLAHLSVEHAGTLGHYRDAHEIYLENERGEANTERLRQALVHYRALFADVLGSSPSPATPSPATPSPATPSPGAPSPAARRQP